jgi:hypothetical protein
MRSFTVASATMTAALLLATTVADVHAEVVVAISASVIGALGFAGHNRPVWRLTGWQIPSGAARARTVLAQL